jgi:hypothetical protein
MTSTAQRVPMFRNALGARSARSVLGRAWLAFALALGALAGATAEGKPPSAAGIDSPGACSQLSYAPAPTPPGGDRASVSPNPDGPMLVGLAFFVTELRDIDAVRDEYSFRGYVRSTWCDPSLAFDPDEVGSDERVFFGALVDQEFQRMWSPGGFPVDAVGRMEVMDRVLRVGHDGTVQNNINISLRVAADFDLQRFPFDRQRLELAVESFRWSAKDLVMVADPEATGFAQDFSIPEWRIEGVGTRVESSNALRSSEPLSRLVLEIDVARRWGFYLWKILLPLVIIVALSWSIFWMTDESVAGRTRITATGVLTIVAYQFVVGEALPRIAYLTLLDKVMVVSFVLLAFTVVQSLIVSRYQGIDMPRAKRVDRISRLLFPGTYLLLLLLVVMTSGR